MYVCVYTSTGLSVHLCIIFVRNIVHKAFRKKMFSFLFNNCARIMLNAASVLRLLSL